MSLRFRFPRKLLFPLRRLRAALLFALLGGAISWAQETTVVPRLVQFNGAVSDTPSGTTEVVFALYKDQTDRVALWQETQSVSVDAAGHYSVLLGAGNRDGIPSDLFKDGSAHWLGVTVGGQAEQPRVLLTSVPYAMKASDAETLGGLPASAFLREGADAPPSSRTTAPASNNPAGKATKTNTANIAAPGAKAGYIPVFTDTTGDLGNSLIYQTPKYVGIGTAIPANPLTVAGVIQSSAGGFLFPDSTMQITGVPKCASGQNPLWSGSAWACVTPSVKLGAGLSGGIASGLLTLNTSAVTSAKLGAGLTGSIAGGLLTLNTSALTSATLGAGLKGSIAGNLLTLNTDPTYLQQRVAGTCASGNAIASIGQSGTVTCQAVGAGAIALPVNWTAASSGGVLTVTNTTPGPSSPTLNAPAAILGKVTGAGFAVEGMATSGQGIAVVGYSTGTADTPAIMALSSGTSGKTAGFDAELYSPSATGLRLNFNVDPTSGSMIQANNATRTKSFIVDGNADISTTGGLSVHGVTTLNGGLTVSGGTGLTVSGGHISVNEGGTFGSLTINGNLQVNGNISKASGTFKIDHPLDPANKYLYHSFVESPDMMNIYNGNVVTDAHGLVIVTLPGYFQALNQDFRYQLTVIGQFAQAIVAEEISNNRFTIQTDKPNVKVSWQVTGIRHDAFAEAHRVVVEEDKPVSERGTYLHPELFTTNPGSAEK